ncbi:MAG: hypothetical protein EAZ92_14105 [Candidatus Kapaibacterium sp.]|nr:MAG: hypothetical protein EAZ92_14105 [Candidatus Kapabacteria bacterium]
MTVSPLRTRLKSLFQAFFICVSCCASFSLSACLETDPPLDTTGDLTFTDIRIGTGDAILRDTTTIMQVGLNFKIRLKDSTVVQDSQGQTILNLVGSTLQQNVSLGLDSALRGMRVGGTRRVVVPPRLAFGNRKTGNIPANSTVIYEIELRSLELFKRDDVVVGTGDSAKINSSASVKYVGRLTNGNVFDASLADSPLNFRLGQRAVITGWELGVLNMRVGGKRKLVIPSLLGYGAQGRAPLIPANATLVFDIELVSVAN